MDRIVARQDETHHQPNPQACRHEAGIHRSLPRDHPNLLELLGLKFDRQQVQSSSNSTAGCDLCYMLFPLMPDSLRGELTRRNVLLERPRDTRQCFTTKEVLGLLGGLVDGLSAMHDRGISHRDFKVENILLRTGRYADLGPRNGGSGGASRYIPVIMDFGSAGPLSEDVATRSDALRLVEAASSHTTLAYRPPELFDGGVRHGPGVSLAYDRVDVWGLGCVLFGLMHGCSPYEMDFVRGPARGGREDADGLARVVECTHLKILGELPWPPRFDDGGTSSTSSKSSGRYPRELYELVRYMADHDRARRPGVRRVAARFAEVHLGLTGDRWVPYGDGCGGVGRGGEDDGFDSLVASRDFV